MITVPENAVQHKTAGPYSPVIRLKNVKDIVVISGQAALDFDGDVIGTTIEEQTEAVLRNCEMQLKKAGCSFSDVFKVNVFMKDLKDWGRFNKVYSQIMTKPYPVRTAVQTGLLDTFLVEIEMWAQCDD